MQQERRPVGEAPIHYIVLHYPYTHRPELTQHQL